MSSLALFHHQETAKTLSLTGSLHEESDLVPTPKSQQIQVLSPTIPSNKKQHQNVADHEPTSFSGELAESDGSSLNIAAANGGGFSTTCSPLARSYYSDNSITNSINNNKQEQEETNHQSSLHKERVRQAEEAFDESVVPPGAVVLGPNGTIYVAGLTIKSKGVFVDPSRYKTRVCRHHNPPVKDCPFGDRCVFAHSEKELSEAINGKIDIDKVRAEILENQAKHLSADHAAAAVHHACNNFVAEYRQSRSALPANTEEALAEHQRKMEYEQRRLKYLQQHQNNNNAVGSFHHQHHRGQGQGLYNQQFQYSSSPLAAPLPSSTTNALVQSSSSSLHSQQQQQRQQQSNSSNETATSTSTTKNFSYNDPLPPPPPPRFLSAQREKFIQQQQQEQHQQQEQKKQHHSSSSSSSSSGTPSSTGSNSGSYSKFDFQPQQQQQYFYNYPPTYYNSKTNSGLSERGSGNGSYNDSPNSYYIKNNNNCDKIGSVPPSPNSRRFRWNPYHPSEGRVILGESK